MVSFLYTVTILQCRVWRRSTPIISLILESLGHTGIYIIQGFYSCCTKGKCTYLHKRKRMFNRMLWNEVKWSEVQCSTVQYSAVEGIQVHHCELQCECSVLNTALDAAGLNCTNFPSDLDILSRCIALQYAALESTGIQCRAACALKVFSLNRRLGRFSLFVNLSVCVSLGQTPETTLPDGLETSGQRPYS